MNSQGTKNPEVAHAAAIAVACGSFKPISSSRQDTIQTRDEIIEHNAVGKKICGWTALRASAIKDGKK